MQHSFHLRSFLSLLLLVATMGCTDTGPTRVSVGGTIVVNGTPLPKGTITFVPTANTRGPKTSAPVTDGKYKLTRKRGPVPGKLRVEILAHQELGFALDDPEEFDAKAPRVLPGNPIPPRYNLQSTLIREAKSGHPNQFDFQLETQTLR